MKLNFDKETHDKRVEFNKTIGEEPEIDTETGWACLDRNRKRMQHTIPGNSKESSFILALDTADAELFTRWEDDDKYKYKCIIKNMKDDWKSDEKFFNAPHQLKVRVGDTVTWDRLKIRWLVVWQDLIYKDFFRGEVHRATHLIRWKNKNGFIKEQWAAVKGPVETRAKYEQSAGLIENGRQNDHIEFYIGANDKENIQALKRYQKVKVFDKTWRVHIIDNISSESVYRFSCVEDFNNNAEDDVLELIPGGQVDFGENEIEIPEDPEEIDEYCRIVGPRYIRKGLEESFFAVDYNEKPIEGTFEVMGAKSKPGDSENEVLVIGTKIGEKATITFTSKDGNKINSVTVDTVSILG